MSDRAKTLLLLSRREDVYMAVQRHNEIILHALREVADKSWDGMKKLQAQQAMEELQSKLAIAREAL